MIEIIASVMDIGNGEFVVMQAVGVNMHLVFNSLEAAQKTGETVSVGSRAGANSLVGKIIDTSRRNRTFIIDCVKYP